MQAKSTLDILRTLLVFQTCKIGPLVRHADTVLAWSKRLLGSTLTYAAIRHTFYKQFVAGESLEAICTTVAVLRWHGIGSIAVVEAEAGQTLLPRVSPSLGGRGAAAVADPCSLCCCLCCLLLPPVLLPVLPLLSVVWRGAAGEDARRIQPTLHKMKASGVRAILDYAAVECRQLHTLSCCAWACTICVSSAQLCRLNTVCCVLQSTCSARHCRQSVPGSVRPARVIPCAEMKHICTMRPLCPPPPVCWVQRMT